MTEKTTESTDKKPEKTVIHLLAGQKPDGELIYEEVAAMDIGDGCYELASSPVFARGAAKKDVIRMMAAGRFEVEQYNGNLCIRVFVKEDIDTAKTRLEAALKPLEGELDYANERILVFSVPVKSGFEKIEASINQALQGKEETSMWLYANVYDPVDGETPLNWWHDFLAK